MWPELERRLLPRVWPEQERRLRPRVWPEQGRRLRPQQERLFFLSFLLRFFLAEQICSSLASCFAVQQRAIQYQGSKIYQVYDVWYLTP